MEKNEIPHTDHRGEESDYYTGFKTGYKLGLSHTAPENQCADHRGEESELTRIEVIEHYTGGNGRNYVNWHKDNKVELSYQDNNRTLKIFITRNP